jgi:hypothetical protein
MSHKDFFRITKKLKLKSGGYSDALLEKNISQQTSSEVLNVVRKVPKSASCKG